MNPDHDASQNRLGPRSVGRCHVRQPRFERLNNLLRLAIIYATFGTQAPPGLRSRNRLPHHRLLAIPSSSVADGGRVGFQQDGRPCHLELRPGSVLLLPGGRSYSFTFHPGLELAGVHFDLERFAGRDAFDEHQAPRRLAVAAATADAAWSLRDRLERLDGIARLRAWTLDTAARLLDHDLDDLLAQQRARDRFAPVLELLDRDPRADRRIADLAELVDLAPATLSRRFSAAFGLPLKRYMERRLAQHACDRLLGSDRAIHAIAADLGFSSEFYFSRFVKRHVGVPPSVYRHLDQNLG